LACVLIFGTKAVYAQTVNIDTAINNVGDEFSHGLKNGSKVAILAIRSNSVKMSRYIIEELAASFVKQKLITVVDNVQLDPVRAEMNYLISGEGSTTSAQSIGKKVGAQYVITGTFEPVGNYYRFRAQVLDVDTAAIILNYSVNVQNDQAVASLMGSSGSNSSSTEKGESVFSPGQRWGTFALNAFVLPGLGSYVIMKDTAGGTFQLIMGLSGDALYWTGFALMMTSRNGMLGVSIPLMSTGGALFLANGIYNIIRSSVYNIPPKTASLFDPSALKIAVLPAKDGSIDKVHFSYTMHF